jgi:indolepyruvate ferredoxin oxidoreductase
MAVLRHCRWLRNLMPAWHQRERDFREWYMGLVDTCDLSEPWKYNLWLDILKSPEPVTGFREVRYPKMDAARQKVSELQHALAAGPNDPRFRATRSVSLTNQVIPTFRGS